MKRFIGFEKGMGIGGWLTNYKRFNVLPDEMRMQFTVGDMEHFASYITKDDVKNIKSMGFDHIRVGFDQIVLESEPFVYREETMNCLENFVSWCKEENINLVLNLHKSIGNYCDIPEPVTLIDSVELQDRVSALWLELERRFHDEDQVVFELLNEVVDVNPEKWNDLAERIIGDIRKVNPTRKIIVGTTCWNSCHKLKYLRTYDDENIIYTFHMYEPFEFTHQRGVLQWRPLYYNRALTYPCDDIERYREYRRIFNEPNYYNGYERIDREFIYNFLAPVREFIKNNPDKIVWCGEFGTIRHADAKSRVNYMRDVISVLKEMEVPYCVWNYLSTPNDGNRFSLVDDDTREILSQDLLDALLGKM